MINHGHGVRLGPLDYSARGELRQWRNDPRIFKWTRQNDVITDLDQDRWFMRQAEDPTIKMYMIHVDDATDAHVGVCGFTDIDRMNRRAEFSLYIEPGRHGCGLGTKALKTLFKHGFQGLGFNLIWGETFEGNPAVETFEKIGMTKEGTRREFYFREGKFIGAHLYSVTREEWNRLSLGSDSESQQATGSTGSDGEWVVTSPGTQIIRRFPHQGRIPGPPDPFSP